VRSENIKNLFYLFWAFVLVSAFFFPARLAVNSNSLYAIADVFPSIRTLRERSAFPAALSFTGLIAIFLGACLAFIFSSSDLIRKVAKFFRVVRGKLGTVIIGLFGIALPYLIVLVEIHDRNQTKADAFFRSMATNRFFLAFWGGGVFLIFFFCISSVVGATLAMFFSGEDE